MCNTVQAMKLAFNGTTGHLIKITNQVSGISSNVDQQFLWWNSSDGDNLNSTQVLYCMQPKHFSCRYEVPHACFLYCVGFWYIFRPNGTAPFEVSGRNKANITVIKVSYYYNTFQYLLFAVCHSIIGVNIIIDSSEMLCRK